MLIGGIVNDTDNRNLVDKMLNIYSWLSVYKFCDKKTEKRPDLGTERSVQLIRLSCDNHAFAYPAFFLKIRENEFLSAQPSGKFNKLLYPQSVDHAC